MGDLRGYLRVWGDTAKRGARSGDSDSHFVPRCHIITQFNRGVYDYIVATDEEAPAAPPECPPRKKQRKGTAPR